MKFGQLLEYNMGKVLVKKLYTKCGEETSPRPYSQKLKLSISLDQQYRVLYSLFILHAKLAAINIY